MTEKTATTRLREITYDTIPYVCPSWEEMGTYTFELAKQILASGEHFDRVVALAKGGWTWTRTLVDYLGIDAISSIGIKSYSGVNEASEPQITQPLTDAINGKRVLIFDEVVQRGKSVQLAKKYLEAMGAEVKIATLCTKPETSILPDFSAFTTEAWVVFPHEVREFIEQSFHRWTAHGIPMNEVISRLEHIGLPKEQILFFVGRLTKK